MDKSGENIEIDNFLKQITLEVKKVVYYQS